MSRAEQPLTSSPSGKISEFLPPARDPGERRAQGLPGDRSRQIHDGLSLQRDPLCPWFWQEISCSLPELPNMQPILPQSGRPIGPGRALGGTRHAFMMVGLGGQS